MEAKRAKRLIGGVKQPTAKTTKKPDEPEAGEFNEVEPGEMDELLESGQAWLSAEDKAALDAKAKSRAGREKAKKK